MEFIKFEGIKPHVNRSVFFVRRLTLQMQQSNHHQDTPIVEGN